MSGRRAAFGVAFKNARRNKKRTFYLVLMIAIPVLVAVMTSAVVRLGHVTAEEDATSEYGAANVMIEQYESNPELAVWIDGEVEELAPNAPRLDYRLDWTVFGTDEYGQIVDINLDNPLSDGVLTLVQGQNPSAGDEVVLTEHLARFLGVGIGDTVDMGRDEQVKYRVVGLASHPVLWDVNKAVVAPGGFNRLDNQGFGQRLLLSVEDDQAFSQAYALAWDRDRFQFYSQDREWPMPQRYEFLPEFYYAAMSEDQLAELDRVLDTEGQDGAWAYTESLFSNGVEVSLPETSAQSRSDRLMWSRENIASTGPVIGTGVAALILAEVAFIAGAAFATGTRRRLREIGLMGANGASPKHVRSTVVGEGLVVGLVGGLAGSAAAFLLITLGRSTIQEFVSRRIDSFPFSPLDIVGPILVAVVACAIAAWIPARTASSVPTLTALQGRMPVSAPKRWIIPAGLGVTGFGALLLAVGLAGQQGMAAAVAVVGAILMIAGMALLSGPLVAWISKHAERFPITPRIVLRDSGRQRGRAAAAVAATMVILMAPIAALATIQQSEANQAIEGLAVASPQVLIEGVNTDDGSTEPLTEEALAPVREAMPDATIARFTVIDVPVKYPVELAETRNGHVVTDGQYYLSPWRMSVASDELLGLLDSDRLTTALDRDGIALIGVTDRTSSIEVNGETMSVAEVPIGVQRWSFPRVMVTEETAAAYADFPSRPEALLEQNQSWFQSLNPFYDPVRPLWDAGLGLEMSGGSYDISPALIGALVFLAAMLIVLIVVATITALSAAEGDSELRTVVAVGATNSIRRKYLGLQSGMHTLLGALLSVPLTLLLMLTAHSSVLGGYRQIGAFGVFDSSDLYVPWGGIAILVVGLPLTIGLITAVTVRSAPTTPPRRAT